METLRSTYFGSSSRDHPHCSAGRPPFERPDSDICSELGSLDNAHGTYHNRSIDRSVPTTATEKLAFTWTMRLTVTAAVTQTVEETRTSAKGTAIPPTPPGTLGAV
ncbi:MAG: hypothetical protein ACETV1_07080 [Candidatus Bathyarchaeia archaeon]